jgi:hypothetical protein
MVSAVTVEEIQQEHRQGNCGGLQHTTVSAYSLMCMQPDGFFYAFLLVPLVVDRSTRGFT